LDHRDVGDDEPDEHRYIGSGMTEKQRIAEATQLGIKTFLSKHYTAEKLLQKLSPPN
jgi:hypothetical protein